MSWDNSWPNYLEQPTPKATPTDPRDVMGRDELLLLWSHKKKELEKAKEAEMDLRKYIVKRAFPQAPEGTNTQRLGNDYELKAVIKYNYKLKVPENFDGDIVQAVDDCIDNFKKLSPNEGSFIADRLFNWNVDLSIKEYKLLMADAKSIPLKKKMLDELSKILLITDATPTLEIKEPKVKK